MHVSEWMSHPVRFVKPRDNAYHARTLLEEHRLNQLPVVVDGRLVGIVTDRDLRDAFPSVFETASGDEEETDERVNPEKVLIESVMTNNVLTVAPSQELTEAALTMRRERVGALPVVDGGKLVGILTRSDVIDAFLSREGAVEAKRG